MFLTGFELSGLYVNMLQVSCHNRQPQSFVSYKRLYRNNSEQEGLVLS